MLAHLKTGKVGTVEMPENVQSHQKANTKTVVVFRFMFNQYIQNCSVELDIHTGLCYQNLRTIVGDSPGLPAGQGSYKSGGLQVLVTLHCRDCLEVHQWDKLGGHQELLHSR